MNRHRWSPFGHIPGAKRCVNPGCDVRRWRIKGPAGLLYTILWGSPSFFRLPCPTAVPIRQRQPAIEVEA